MPSFCRNFFHCSHMCFCGCCFVLFASSLIREHDVRISPQLQNISPVRNDIIYITNDSLIFSTSLNGKGFLYSLNCDEHRWKEGAFLKLQRTIPDVSKISIETSILTELFGFQNKKTRYVRIGIGIETGFSAYFYPSKEKTEGSIPTLPEGEPWESIHWKVKKTMQPVGAGVLNMSSIGHPYHQLQLWPFYEIDEKFIPLQSARLGVQTPFFFSCSHLARLHDPFTERAKIRSYLYSTEDWFIPNLDTPILVKEYRLFYVCYDLKTKERKISSIIHSYCGRDRVEQNE